MISQLRHKLGVNSISAIIMLGILSSFISVLTFITYYHGIIWFILSLLGFGLLYTGAIFIKWYGDIIGKFLYLGISYLLNKVDPIEKD